MDGCFFYMPLIFFLFIASSFFYYQMPYMCYILIFALICHVFIMFIVKNFDSLFFKIVMLVLCFD